MKIQAPHTTYPPLQRVAIVSETYAPEANGVATTLAQLAAGLRRDGTTVDLILPRHPERPQGYEEGVHRVPSLGIPRYPGIRCGLVRPHLLEELWRRRPPEVAYIATEGPLGYAALRAAQRLNLPVISGFHTRFDTYSRYYGASLLSPLIARYLRAFHNATTSTLVPDAGLARQLRAQGYRSVETLGRGVDTQRFRPELRSPEMRAGWGATEEAPVLLYVGRIAVEKNLKLAIEAFRSIRAAHPGARFVLVGDGPLRAELQRHHPELIFPGIRRGEELARYYASADVFLFPSLSETFGNVTLEALASGLPVVAFDDAAAGQHVLDTVNGRIAPYGDTDRWIEAALGTALLPAETLQRWRLAARQSVRSLGWQQIARRFGGILASAAALPPSSATEEAPLCSKP